uniref:DNA replication complex GINS protein PSF2 n=1 Tax=Caenorhabditis japonica TaxID=281687 RepID=A0A8R1DUE4_CAEJA
MNAEKCEFLAGNEPIEVIPSISDDKPMHLISGDIGPFEAGVPVRIPIWIALLMKRKHHCKIVMPTWMDVEELKRILTAETECQGLSSLPDYFFEISHMLVRDARDDIFEVEAVKSLVQDIYDRRDAKLRTSAIAFLSQNRTCHAQLDCVQPIEVASARGTLEACKQLGILVRNKHDSTPL